MGQKEFCLWPSQMVKGTKKKNLQAPEVIKSLHLYKYVIRQDLLGHYKKEIKWLS